MIENKKVGTINPDFIIIEDFVYFRGYKEAGDILIDSLSKKQELFITMPILFLYRQYLELGLKYFYYNVIIKYRQKNEELSKRPNHNLKRYFEYIKEHFLEIAGEAISEDISKIEDLINLLETLDKSKRKDGSSYRFSKDIEEKSFYESEYNVDLEELKLKVHEADNAFYNLEQQEDLYRILETQFY